MFALLMIGNSYTYYNDLPDLEQALLRAYVPGLEAAEVSSLTDAGLRWSEHLARTGEDGAWYEALVSGSQSWDRAVLQEQSQTPGLDRDSDDWQESLASLEALDALLEARGAEVTLMLTWGRRDGDASYPDIYPDFPSMQDRLTAGYLAYVEQLSTPERRLTVAPVGPAFARIYQDVLDAGGDPADPSSDFYQLYSEDGSHPSLAGSALASYVIQAAITGYPPAPEGEEDGYLQQIASQVVLDDPFGDFPYPWALQWGAWFPGGAEASIAGIGQRTLVRLSEPAEPLDRLDLGTGAQSSGRLWLEEGAELSVGELAIGGEGEGAVSLRGGSLAAGALTGTGELAISGGTLIVTDRIALPFDQAGGTLAPRGVVSVAGAYSLGPEAELLLDLSWDSALLFEGSVALDGRLRVIAGEGLDPQPGDRWVLLDGCGLDAVDLGAVEIPEGAAIRYDGGADCGAIVLSYEAPPELEDSASPGRDSAGPEDSGGPELERGSACGCGMGGAAAGGAPLWMLGLFALIRRSRRDRGMDRLDDRRRAR